MSLFSGIGGLDCAAEMAGFQTVGQCELSEYPSRVLAKHWPGVPRWKDVREFTTQSFYEWTGLKTVAVLSGGSRASLTALRESVLRLLMNVICGPNTGVSLARLCPDGSWLKMYGGCYQVNWDGSFEEYSGICPGWGIVSDGVLTLPAGLEPSIDESAFSLLPTLLASDWKFRMHSKAALLRHSREHQDALITHLQLWGYTDSEIVETYERVMAFPIGWTEC